MTAIPDAIVTRHMSRPEPAPAVVREALPRPQDLMHRHDRVGDWSAAKSSTEEAMERGVALAGGTANGQHRINGLRQLLERLSQYPGHTWQARWCAAGYEEDLKAWKAVDGTEAVTIYGVHLAIALDLVRPSYAWCKANQFKTWWMLLELRDAPGYARLLEAYQRLEGTPAHDRAATIALAHIAAHTGKRVTDIRGEDLIAYSNALRSLRASGTKVKVSGQHHAWDALREAGSLDHPADTLRIALLPGQLTVEELVDSYGVTAPNVRNALTRYLHARAGALDYSSLRALAGNVCGLFWHDIQDHHPDLDSLRLTEEQAAQWKARLARKRDGSERRSRFNVMLQVRAMYLDVAQWAHLEPEVWAQWAAPSPVTEGDIAGYSKQQRENRSRSHQRTRARAPELPRLLRATEDRLTLTQGWLEAMAAVPLGDEVVHEGSRYVRIGKNRVVLRPLEEESGDVDLTTLEEDAFWSWAIVHLLHQTGLRVEEMLELDQFSIQKWRHPQTREVVPLLHVYPSKAGTERLLVASPELVSILARIVSRLRQEDGSLPLTARYDQHERVMLSPAPLLFQRRQGPRFNAIGNTYVYSRMDDATAWAGLVTATGQPLRFRPHDLRRIFATDAQNSGVPIHVIAALLGHASLETTMVYAAVYSEQVISGHQAFIAQRRALNPSVEQREITDAEWEEFQQHFVERKLSLGSCGRAWGTSCEHEHACVRCSLLRPDPDALPRLLDIRKNLRTRIDEAYDRGWLGEVEGLRVSLVAAEEKIERLERLKRNVASTNLGMPGLGPSGG